jgi:predicted nucleotidyltransferase
MVEIAQWVLGSEDAGIVRRRALAAEGVGPDATAARDTAKSILADLPATDDARRWIPSAVETIVGQFRPVRIVLFGSQVKGGATSDSDADLLVVMDPDPAVDRFAVRHAIGAALSGLPIAKDVIVTTTRDIASGAIEATIVSVALQEGVDVYSRGD